ELAAAEPLLGHAQDVWSLRLEPDARDMLITRLGMAEWQVRSGRFAAAHAALDALEPLLEDKPPPLVFRVDVGKQVFYALDEEEKRLLLEKIAREKIKGQVNVTRFKGLGEMNPEQLRESAIHPDTRRLVQLTVDDGDETRALMDMLLAKKRASDRKAWLETKGDLASLEV
ncbi:MAG: hypothetical protein J7485_14695, partial [Sphingobium sp.]|nr:hypothetical protein [Sphingobium sp.]